MFNLPQSVIDRFDKDVGFSFKQHAIMLCRTGSQSHGMATLMSDEDFLAVIIPPTERIFGLSSFDHWDPKDIGMDFKVYSLQKYIRLLLKNNPNVLETLWLREEDYLDYTFIFGELVDIRDKFSSLRANRVI